MIEHVYIAGPMSNYPQMNFPAFDKAAESLRDEGYIVTSPAELDSPEERAAALASEGDMVEASWGTLLSRDLKIIADEGVEAIVVLPGWERSRGARLETFIGRLLRLPILAYPTLESVNNEQLELAHGTRPVFYPITDLDDHVKKTINRKDRETPKTGGSNKEAAVPDGPIKRALPLVHGDRQSTYGHPADDFARTAGMWQSMFGWKVEARDVPLAMIAVKLSRLQQTPGHKDSTTDICGYAECYEMTMERDAL